MSESVPTRRRMDIVNACLLAVTAVSCLVSIHFCMALRRQPIVVSPGLSIHTHAEGLIEQSKSKKPLMILHVGPPKSSTTTLQSLLSRYHLTLEKDNYLYVGRVYDDEGGYEGYYNKNFRNLVSHSCLNRGGLEEIFYENHEEENSHWSFNEDAPSCWKDFLVELARVRMTGMNVIISDEMFSIRGHNGPDFHYELLKESLQDWDVRIVATYRRFHAWLPSHKNHLDKYRLTISHKKEYKSWDGTPTKPMFQQLKECLDDYSNIRYPYLDAIVANYSKYFPVEVMNMHDEKYPSLAAQFVCQFVPNAENACELSLKDEQSASNLMLNTAKSGFYDILAMDAYSQGVLRPVAGARPFIREEIQRRHEEVRGLGPFDFPLKCPEREEAQLLLDRSLEYEKKFFPEFHRSELGEKAHRKEFWDSFDKNKLCSIDTSETLKQKKWQTFFQKLNHDGENNRKQMQAMKSHTGQ